MNELGELAVELGNVTFEEFQAEARARRLVGRHWLKAKQAGLLNTYIDADGVLHVAAPGQTPEEYREAYPEKVTE